MTARRRPPAVYVVTLGALTLIGVFTLLVSFGVPPFDGLQTFLLGQVVGAFTLLVFGVVGGAFVGMLLAHRMLSSREFTPFERATLESLDDIRSRIERLEDSAQAARSEAAEERARR